MILKNIVLPSRIEKSAAHDEDVYGEFTVYPLERGFGVTLGNAIRRVLLSSMEGAAIWAIRIDGVLHELSTIPGVMEDMPEVILNMKKIVFKMKGEVEDAVCKLEVSKKGEVTAAQIQTPAGIEVVNKDHYLLSMKEDIDLRMELWVKSGRGYFTASQHELPGDDPQLIPVDSLFSPVMKASFDVEDQRVGQRTDYDKLVVKVQSNGSMSPEEAMIKSAELLI
ncbi:MAG: DNA-directed RNA polymerase subunit alpha, partial [Gemmatimonadota bacterium]|nr:DNA-directed RNA polymerase subunit alpha [Gemmatimonadota bacterium]